MKADKIIFTCSEQFSPFWNLQSRIWKTKIGVEPLLLLYGKKANTDVSEEFGRVIEVETDSSIPSILQVTMSKFIFPSCEPDTTWMIGDIDMLPLQTNYFTKRIENIPSDDNVYAHLNFCGISQSMGVDPRTFFTKGGQTTGGVNLPGHYHIAKGKLYGALFAQNRSISEVVRSMVESKRYGMFDPAVQKYIGLDPTIHGSHWCAEEDYTSEILAKKAKTNEVNLQGVCYNNRSERVDRAVWNPKTKSYAFDPIRLAEGGYVDIHCHRPFHEQEESLRNILKMAGMII
jgi:hypothetical protein